MKMTPAENNFLNAIAVNSGKDINTTRDVLRGLLKVISLEMLSFNDKVIIPYICEMKLSYKEVLKKDGSDFKVMLECEPSSTLVKEIEYIIEGNKTPTVQYAQKQVEKVFSSILELFKINLNEN